CARGSLDAVNRPGEALADDGFYAPTLEDERKVPGLHVDQLVLIEDVTDEIVKAFESGKTDEERVRLRQEKIAEVEKRYRDKTGLVCNVITFYNGGRYSLYGYKRYTDVRLVFAVETNVGYFGGDPDNFTYPRYDLDVAFYRVYEDNKPLKTQNFFRWSKAGAAEGEAVFVLGNPGSTRRLFTVSQLEFMRDHQYPFTFLVLDNMVKILSDYIAKHPDKRLKYQTQLFGQSNSQKLFQGRLKGLRDPVLMAKKRDFERKFRAAIDAKPNVRSQYASLWSEIEKLQAERAAIFGEQNIYNFAANGRSIFFTLASNLVDFANQMKLPEDQRNPRLRGAMLDTAKARFYPPELDVELQTAILAFHLSWMKNFAGDGNQHLNALLKGQSFENAAKELAANTILTSKDKVMALLNNPNDVFTSTDPFISFVIKTADRAKEVRDKVNDISQKEAARVQMLGKALYDVYGTSIP
ncbi:MAG TPA: S46 family peptidase, partial [Bacteroidota bacterium]|nr:S46 family peptidase [Bacteroidota bacterium]